MLSRVPFVGLVLTFLAGILLAEFLLTSSFQNYLLNSSIQTVVILVVAVVSFLLYKAKRTLLFSITLSVFLFLCGLLSLILHYESLNNEVQQLTNRVYTSYQATVQSIPEKRAKSIRVDALITKIKVGEKWADVHAKAYLSIPQGASQIPEAGDNILVYGNLERPKPPINPEEFDYQKYLWNKGIVWTDYLPDESFFVLKYSSRAINIYTWSHLISQWSDRQFREFLKDDKAYGLVKAMLLGRRDDLRSDQVDDYTTSGTVHILSVSGMHVAVIFYVLTLLMGWLKRIRGGKYIYLLTITSLMGFYALVTGLPPSVQRATLMCIVFVVSEVFARKHNAVNTLALSALIILLLDPQALFDVGFQLSYLAMIGIFLLYKPMESLWSPSGWLLRYLWQITVLSFAAQLATFPLSLYYFHQFPFYFWLVNPFVITCTNFLLPAALVMLFVCLGPFLWLKTVMSWLVYISAFLTNVSVAVPKSLPGYLIENLSLDKTEVIILYGLIFITWFAYESREYFWLKYCGVLTMLFAIYGFSISIQNYVTPRALVHSVAKHTVISFKEGDRLYVFSDDAFVLDSSAYDFHIKNYAIKNGALKILFTRKEASALPKNLYQRHLDAGDFLSWRGKNIYVGAYQRSCFPLDYFLVKSAKYPKVERLQVNTKTMYLLSGEMKKRTQDHWINLLADHNLKAHDLIKEGALFLP